MSDDYESKVRLTVPEFLYATLAQDELDFNFNQNKLCNRIFEFYANEPISDQPQLITTTENKRILQFTLNKDNQDLYVAVSSSHHIQNKAEYFRQVFFKYCNQAKHHRELVLFDKTVTKINNAIQLNQKLKINYQNHYRTIEPYFIIKSDGETRNYVFCYCEHSQAFRNYRLLNFRAVAVMIDKNEHYDRDYIEQVKANFDPFLSHGQEIKVRLTEQGINTYQRNITHRPKLIDQTADVFTFECSKMKAQLYFPQFMEHAEILQPPELRLWFKQRYEQMINLYQ